MCLKRLDNYQQEKNQDLKREYQSCAWVDMKRRRSWLEVPKPKERELIKSRHFDS